MNGARVIRYLKGRICTPIWRWRGATIADRIVVDGVAPYFRSQGSVTLGSRISFRGRGTRVRIVVARGAHLEIGRRCFINSGAIIDASRSITIGEHCLIGDGAQLRDSDYHAIDEGAAVRSLPIVLGTNVWLGADFKIMPGVTIGDHSVWRGDRHKKCAGKVRRGRQSREIHPRSGRIRPAQTCSSPQK